MQIIDLVIIVLAILALLRGAETGLVRQIATLLGLIAGITAGSAIANLVGSSAAVSIGIVVFCVGMTLGVSEIIGNRFVKVVAKVRLQPINQTLGSAIGLTGCLLVVWLGSALATTIPSTSLKTDIRDSRIIAWLDNTLPPATNVLSWIDSSLARTALPEIVTQLEPTAPNTTATLPASSEFAEALAARTNAIVEIEGRTCGGVGVGSGFVAKNNVVITNAHVVAGMRHPYIKDANGRHRAEVIGFNSDLDIAVLRTGGLAGNPVPLAIGIVPTETQAIAVGYPGGESQTVSPAVIVELFTANSRNIYNESTARRQLYTIKADIEPGNSGGPLLDKSGSVIGVIFAKSTTYNQVGYAITMPAVIQALNEALANPSSGQNLRCSTV